MLSSPERRLQRGFSVVLAGARLLTAGLFTIAEQSVRASLVISFFTLLVAGSLLKPPRPMAATSARFDEYQRSSAPDQFRSRATGTVLIRGLGSNYRDLSVSTRLTFDVDDPSRPDPFETLMHRRSVLPLATIDTSDGLYLTLRDVVVISESRKSRSYVNPAGMLTVALRVRHIDVKCGPPACVTQWYEP